MRDFTVAVVLPAAGSGSRLGADRPKAFVELCGAPLWRRSLGLFLPLDCVTRCVLVVAAADLAAFAAANQAVIDGDRVRAVTGGATRADSVAAGVATAGDCDLIAVHDAARPLAYRAEIDAVFAAADETGAAILAAPIASTVKRVADGVITETVPRDDLWEAQTPQVARADLMRRAYAERGDQPATDEAALLERLGVPVAVVKGSARNFKITTPADFRLAEALLRADADAGGTDA